MTISITIQNYLEDLGIGYALLAHDHTETSSMTAEASHVPGSRLVKAVIIKTHDDYMMALLPASHHLHLNELQDLLGRKVDLAAEEELTALFDDCDIGAVPALGEDRPVRSPCIINRDLLVGGDELLVVAET